MGKSRKRGKKKKSTLPSHLRVAKREGRLIDLADDSGEEMDQVDVVESIEDRAIALAEELSELPYIKRESSVTATPVSGRERTPQPGENVVATQRMFDNDEEAPQSPILVVGDGEVNGSVEPEGEFPGETHNAEESELPDELHNAEEEMMSSVSESSSEESSSDESADVVDDVHCLCLCRISGNKYMSAKENPGKTLTQRRKMYDADREAEGDELIRRFERAEGIRFKSSKATLHKRQSYDPLDYTDEKVRSGMGKDIRAFFKNKRGSKAIVLIRAIDGLTIDKGTMLNFCKMVKTMGVHTEIVYQYNKVFDGIRHPNLVDCKGLGGIVRFQATDFLNHLRGAKKAEMFTRITRIWKWLNSSKNRGQGIQDRNNLLPEDHPRPLEGTMTSLVRF